jgi:hypothetical protein
MSIAVAGFMAFYAISAFSSFASIALGLPAASARLRILALRNETADLGSSRLGGFGLLQNGCLLSPALPANLNNGIAVVNLDSAAQVNGYYLVTGTGPVVEDPVRWVMEVSAAINASGADEWTTLGASGWMNSYLYPEAAYPTPIARGQLVAVDMRWDLGEFLGFQAFTVWAAAQFAAIIAARLGYYSAPRLIYMLACLAMVCFYSASTAIHVHEGNRIAAIYIGVNLVSNQYQLIYLGCFQQHFILHFIFVPCILDLITVFTADIMVLKKPAGDALARFFLSNNGLMFFFSLSIIALRLGYVQRAKMLLAGDKACYDTAWADVLAEDSGRPWIRDLADAARSVARACPRTAPRQIQRLDGVPQGAIAYVLRWVGGGQQAGGGAAPALTSLDQLYSQAALRD